MKVLVNKIERPFYPKLEFHLLVNGSWSSNAEQFLIKRGGFVYVFDGWFDRLNNRGWCGGFRKLNEPTSLLYAKEFCASFYDLKYKVISEALSQFEEIWKADYKDIVEEAINWANLS